MTYLPRTVLDEHFGYVGDAARLDAYQRALACVVKPGSIVVDLGSGTGILGLLACRAGARRVYAIERSDIVHAARDIAQANGFADRVVCIQASSRDTDVPERAGVIVADQMGPLGCDAGLIGDFADAAARLLTPGGRMVPEHVATWMAPVEASDAWASIGRWTDVAGFDLAPLRARARNSTILVARDPDVLLSDPVEAFAFASGAPEPSGSVARTALEWHVTRPGLLHGILGWFVARLVPGVVVTNGPSGGTRLQRSSLMMPMDVPIEVRRGDAVSADVTVALATRSVAWRITVRRAGVTIHACEQAMLRARLQSREVRS